MTMDDINNLDFNNLGDWPLPIKVVAVLLICGALLFAGYWFDTKEQLVVLEKAELEEQNLRKEFEKKQKQANTLEQLKRQLEQIKESFGELLKRLPNETEVDDVLVDISQTGLASGLTFELFQPQQERKGKDAFYRELPIRLQMVGTYHAFGKFVSGVAALPRIVTQHNVSISPQKSGMLELNATAKTYRYVDEQEKSRNK